MKITLKVLDQGLYCPPGDFFIDAWKPVPTSLITHAHGDHALLTWLHFITRSTLY